MSAEPDFIAQTEQDPSLHRAWFEACTQEAKQKGCAFGRYSVHEGNERLALVEGWVNQPDDQGEQRWDLPTP